MKDLNLFEEGCSHTVILDSEILYTMSNSDNKAIAFVFYAGSNLVSGKEGQPERK